MNQSKSNILNPYVKENPNLGCCTNPYVELYGSIKVVSRLNSLWDLFVKDEVTFAIDPYFHRVC